MPTGYGKRWSSRGSSYFPHLRYRLLGDSFRLSLTSRKSSLTVGKPSCVGLPKSTWGHISKTDLYTKNSKAQVGLQLLVERQRTQNHPEDAHYILHPFILHFSSKMLPYQYMIGARSWGMLLQICPCCTATSSAPRDQPQSCAGAAADLRWHFQSSSSRTRVYLLHISSKGEF